MTEAVLTHVYGVRLPPTSVMQVKPFGSRRCRIGFRGGVHQLRHSGRDGAVNWVS
jgi:hypothetical protein